MVLRPQVFQVFQVFAACWHHQNDARFAWADSVAPARHDFNGLTSISVMTFLEIMAE